MQNYNKKKYIEILAETLTRKTGVKIESGEHWKVNMENKTLIYNEKDLKSIPIYIIRGLLLHEIGHLNYSGIIEETDTMRKYGKEVIGYVYNVFEDVRVNDLLSQKYQDYAVDSLSFADKNSLQFLKEIRPRGFFGINKLIPRLKQFMLITAIEKLNAIYRYYGSGISYSTGVSLDFLSRVLSDDVINRYRGNYGKIGSIVNRTCDTKNVMEMVKIIDKDFIPIITDYLREQKEENEKNQDSQKKNNDNNDNKDNENDKKDESKKEDGDNKNNQKDDKDKKDNKKDDKKDNKENDKNKENNKKDDKDNKKGDDKKDDKKDDGGNDDKKDKEKDEEKDKNGKGGDDDNGKGDKKDENKSGEEKKEDSRTEDIKYNHEIIDGFLSENINDKMNSRVFNIKGFGNKAGDGNVAFLRDKIPEQEAKCVMRLSINVLSRKLEDILKKRKSIRWRGHKKSGTLVSKDIYKILTDSKRPFSKKSNPDVPKYSVYLAVDSSGSMQQREGSTPRYCHAYYAMVLIKDVCKKLGFNIKIYDYNDSAHEITNNIESYMETIGGTYDHNAMRLILEDIDDEDDNIVFFITDGETNTSRNRKEMVLKLKRKSIFCGIGIGDYISEDTLKCNYPNYLKVNSVEKLPMVLANLLYRLVKKQ